MFVSKAILDSATEQWGIKVARVEIKDVRIPVAMQRVMAAEAEATQEARAKVRPMAMLTPNLQCPFFWAPKCFCFFLIVKVVVLQCHFYFFYVTGCGSGGRDECF